MMEARAGRPLLLIDLAVPRDIDAGVRRARAASRCTTSTTCRPSWPATARCARPRRARPRPSSRRRSSASRAGSARSRCCRRWPRCARTATEVVEQVLGENDGPLGVGLGRATSSASRRWRARSSSACCTSRRCACRQLDAERRHARLQLLRELFGLDEGRRLPPSRARPAPRAAADAPARPTSRDPRRCGSAPAAARWRSPRRAGSPSGSAGAELVEITTAGDRAPPGRRQVALGRRDRGARCSPGEIDLAVHSAKDVPGELADGLELAAHPRARRRADDVLCGARVAGRRCRPGRASGRAACGARAQLRAGAADLEVVELRGNVDTRLRKLGRGRGRRDRARRRRAERLGREREAGGVLDELVPAAGQGALALEARAGDAEVAEAVRGLADPTASACVERRARRSCARSAPRAHTAVGAHATLLEDGAPRAAWLRGRPRRLGVARDRLTAAAGSHAGLGLAVGERMLAAGAGELLRAAEATA